MASPVLQEKLLDYIGCTGAVMEKTAQMYAEKKAQSAKLAELIPEAVQALLDNERIEPHQKDAAARVLQNPVEVLRILIKTAQHRNDAERAALGKPLPIPGQVKKASYNSLTSNYPGERRGDESDKESTRALLTGLNLPVN